MGIVLVDPESMRRLIGRRARDPDWWVIPVATPEAAVAAMAIVAVRYLDAGPELVQVANLSACPAAGIGWALLAHRSRMGLAALVELLLTLGELHVPEEEARRRFTAELEPPGTMPVLANDPSDPALLDRLQRFEWWLSGRPGTMPANGTAVQA